MICIDIIEKCNFECYFCMAKDITKPEYMSLDLFKSIILQAKEMGITKVDMIPSKGEPFLHPDIYEMLDFANTHMKYVVIFTNASAININKLKSINRNNILLCVSYYGSTLEKFKELTAMDKNLFDAVHKKLLELDNNNIEYKLEHRDYGWTFNYPGSKSIKNLDPEIKCSFHSMPKITATGDVVFCKFIRDNICNTDLVAFANLNTTSLKDALENPIRYKFFDSQSICVKHCSSYNATCYKEDIISFKILSNSKKQYLKNKDTIDTNYKIMENNIK